MAQSFLQSAGRAFARTAPTAGELLRLSQGNRLLTLQESLARTAADQLKIDKAAIKLLTEDDEQTAEEIKDQATALGTVKEFSDILKIPSGIIKPPLQAFLNRVEQQVGKPLSPLFKEVVSKGKQEDLQSLANVITRNALADPDFGTEKLTQAVTSDDITMTTLMQVGKQVSSERQATKDAEAPGAVQPPKFPEIEARLAGNKKRLVQIQRRRDRKLEKRDRVIEAGAKPAIIKIFTDAVNKFDTQIKGIENEIGEDLRFLESKGFSREERLQGQEFATGERGARQEFQTGERVAGQTFTAGQNVIAAEKGSPLAKLQLLQQSLEQKLEKGRVSGTLTLKTESDVIRRIEQTKAGIKKQNFITGTTETDFKVNVNAADASQIELEIATRRTGVEQMNAYKNRVAAILDDNPDANTFIARTAVFARGFVQNIKAGARVLNMTWDGSKHPDGKKVHFNPANWSQEDLKDLGTSNVRLQSIGIAMAFALAVARNQTGKALSDADLKLFFKELGLGSEDPKLIMASLNEVVSSLSIEARIAHNGVFNAKERPFELFSFEEGGTPIPGVTPAPSTDIPEGSFKDKSTKELFQILTTGA